MQVPDTRDVMWISIGYINETDEQYCTLMLKSFNLQSETKTVNDKSHSE